METVDQADRVFEREIATGINKVFMDDVVFYIKDAEFIDEITEDGVKITASFTTPEGSRISKTYNNSIYLKIEEDRPPFFILEEVD